MTASLTPLLHVLDLALMLVAARLFGAAAAGDQLGYLLGRRWGPRSFNRAESRVLARSHVDRAEVFFAEHGSHAVIRARFVPVVRTVAPVVAGVARMPRRTFAVRNVVGAALWAIGFLVAGYFLGDVPVARHVEMIAVGVVALSFTPAAIAVARHRRRAHRKAGAFGKAVDVAEVLG